MLRLFIDASVIFSMAYSDKEASREIFNLARLQKATLVTCTYALQEVTARVRRDCPGTLAALQEIVPSHIFVIEEANETEIIAALPVVAGARRSASDALVSFDRKHLHTRRVADYIHALVIASAEALRTVREHQ